MDGDIERRRIPTWRPDETGTRPLREASRDAVPEEETTSNDDRGHKRRRSARPTLRLLYSCGRIVDSAPVPLAAGNHQVGRTLGLGPLSLAQDGRISRHHLSLSVDLSHRRVSLTDLSTHGTEVDGRPVHGPVLLSDGAIVSAGETIMQFRWLGDSDEQSSLGMVGISPSLSDVRHRLRVVAPSDSAVLILGETGTGKELTAQAIHRLSGRSGDLVTVNCGAVPRELAEAALFGHVSGAFTGAHGPSLGLFRAAHGGTLFLDELGELPLEIQVKLLRAIEERTVTPVGSIKPVATDIRIIAATNRPLLDDLARGRFRSDLYARLTDAVVELPPLRERREDVLMLFRHAWGRDDVLLTFDCARALVLHSWPLNVREVVRMAKQLRLEIGSKSRISLADVSGRLHQSKAIASALSVHERQPQSPVEARPRAIPSRDELLELLRKHDGVVAHMALECGRSRKQVYRWVEHHGLSVEDFRRDA